MTFLNPALFALASLGTIIVLLYILKVKRREVLISSTVLWASLVKDLQASQPFQKLRFSLLLILQILALLAVVTALANPVTQSLDLEGKTIIVVIDNSASMAANDCGGKSRLEDAKAKAAAFVSASHSARAKPVFMLISTSPAPLALTPFTQDADSVAKKIQSVPQTDAETDAAMLEKLVAGASVGREGVQVIAFSDGALPIKSVMQSGSSDDNAGIISFNVFPPAASELDNISLSDLESGIYPFKIHAAVKNFSSADVQSTISLYHDDKLISSKELEIAPHKTRNIVFSEKLPAGRIRISLDRKDILDADNQCSANLPDLKPFRILLVGEEDQFLLRCFDATPFCIVDQIASEPSNIQKEYELIVFYNSAARRSYSANVVKIGTANEGDGTEDFPEIVDITPDHPLMSGVRVKDIVIGKAVKLRSSPMFTTLLAGTGGIPLLRVAEDKSVELQFAFDFSQTDLRLRPAFVILWSNLIEYLRYRNYKPFVLTGKDFPRAAPCVNLISEVESDVKVSGDRYQVSGEGDTPAKEIVTAKPLYWAFAGFMLAVLLFEWFAFHKRLGQ